MAQQTFSGVPGAFSAGEVLSAADQELLRDWVVAQIKEGQTGDTGEILPMIMDLTNNRIVLDSGGLEFSDATTQTTAATMIAFSGTTANGVLTYNSASTITTQSTATYASDTLSLTGSGGGLKMNGLESTDPNTLDDYEVGVFTMAVTCGDGSVTMTSGEDTCAYVKIGRAVHIQGWISLSAISAPGDWLRITGLPFTAAALAESADHAFIGIQFHGVASDTAGVPYAHIKPNETQLRVNSGSGSAVDYNIANSLSATSVFIIGGTYYAST